MLGLVEREVEAEVALHLLLDAGDPSMTDSS